MIRLLPTLLRHLVTTPELPAVGSPAPAWEAEDHTGRRWSAEALRGERYLVWFYPKAMTPG